MLETIDIDGVEIFAVGKWNGDSYSGEDLDGLVEAYNQTKGKFSPFLKLSHDDSQALAKKSGLAVAELPALGVIEGVRRVGNKLFADFKRVPKKLAALMQAGAYRTRSAEIWKNMDFDGSKFKYMLKAVGLLGAEAPAVSGLNSLDDIIALYSAEKAGAYQTNAEVAVYDYDPTALTEAEQMEELKKQMAEMEKKFSEESAEAKKKITDLEAGKVESDKKFSEVEAKVKTLETERDEQKVRADKAELEVKKHSDEKRALEIKTTVDELVRIGKLSPAQKDFAVAILDKGLSSGELQFKAGEKEYKTPQELLLGLIEAGAGVSLSTDLKSHAGKAERDSSDEMDKEIKEYMEKNKVSYKQAYIEVSKGK